MLGRSAMSRSVSLALGLAAQVALNPFVRGRVGLWGHVEDLRYRLVRRCSDVFEHPPDRRLEVGQHLLVRNRQRLDRVRPEELVPGRLLDGELALEVVDRVEGEPELALLRPLVAGALTVHPPGG